MTRCAVLLRGVNVGGRNRLPMADFRAALDRLGCTEIATYVNSGNALVTAEPAGLAARVEQALGVRAVVLTADELAAVVDGCPWRERADAQPTQVHVAYVDRLPAPDRLAALAERRGDDELAVGPRALYLSYAGPSQDAPLGKALARTELGVRWTARNWTTAVELSRRC